MDGKRGWWVVFGAFLTLAITAGVSFFVLPVMIEAIMTETSWTLTEVSLGITLWCIAAGVFSPVLGGLIDRFGARPVMAAGVLAVCAAGQLVPRVTNLPQFYGALALLGASGMACTYIPVAAVVARWFVRLRGIATGIAMLGLAAGGTISPLITQALMKDGSELAASEDPGVIADLTRLVASLLMKDLSWREAYPLMAGGILLAWIPIFLFIKNPSPEEEAAYAAQAGDGIDPQHDLTMRGATRTRSFWGLTMGDMLTGLIFSIFNNHLIFYLTSDLGNGDSATQVYSVLQLCLGLGVLVFGPLADRLPMRLILTVCYGLPALATLLLLPSGMTMGLALGFALVAGLAGGGRAALFPTALVHCFGETHLAMIFGLTNLFFMLGNAAGPVIGAQIYDATTSTRSVYAVCIATLCISAGLVSLIRAERRLPKEIAEAFH